MNSITASYIVTRHHPYKSSCKPDLLRYLLQLLTHVYVGWLSVTMKSAVMKCAVMLNFVYRSHPSLHLSDIYFLEFSSYYCLGGVALSANGQPLWPMSVVTGWAILFMWVWIRHNKFNFDA